MPKVQSSASPLCFPLSMSHCWSLVALDVKLFQVTVSSSVSHCLIHCSGLERGLCPVAASLKDCFSCYCSKVNLYPFRFIYYSFPHILGGIPLLFIGRSPFPHYPQNTVASCHTSTWKIFSITYDFFLQLISITIPIGLCVFLTISFIGNLETKWSWFSSLGI